MTTALEQTWNMIFWLKLWNHWSRDTMTYWWTHLTKNTQWVRLQAKYIFAKHFLRAFSHLLTLHLHFCLCVPKHYSQVKAFLSCYTLQTKQFKIAVFHCLNLQAVTLQIVTRISICHIRHYRHYIHDYLVFYHKYLHISIGSHIILWDKS